MAIELFGKFLQGENTVIMLRDSDPSVDFNFSALLKGDRTNDSLSELVNAGLFQLKSKYFTEAAIIDVEDKVKQFEQKLSKMPKENELQNMTKEVNDLKNQLKTQTEAHDALAKSFQEFVDKMKG